MVRLAYIYINLHKPCLEAQGDTKVSLKSKGPSKPSGLSLHPVWSKPTGTTAGGPVGGADRGLQHRESNSVPSSTERGQGCVLHSSVETTEGSSRFISSPGPVPPPPTFHLHSWGSLLSACGPGLPYRPREVHRSPEESPLGCGATGPPAPQQAVLPEFLDLAGSGLEAGGYQLWPFTKMPVDLVPCWFTAGEQRMADTALTTPPNTTRSSAFLGKPPEAV